MKKPSIALLALLFPLALSLPAQSTKPIPSTDGYPLNTCVVSGKSLAKKSKTIEVDGRTVKVCCGKCAKKVRKKTSTYLKKIDAAIIAQQSPNYPLSNCPISGKKLGKMGKPKNLILEGQLVKLCCGGCAKKAKAKSKTILAMIHKEAYLKQIKGHENGKGMTCVVSHKPADRKGTAKLIMHGNTLVAVCCKNCLKKFMADPNKYLPGNMMGMKKTPRSRPAEKKEHDHGDHQHGDQKKGHDHG